ncbi:hypothetical protein HAX54_043900, partial [Datura stramonium]|nr:hypothetical protein [Datura stramonium]
VGTGRAELYVYEYLDMSGSCPRCPHDPPNWVMTYGWCTAPTLELQRIAIHKPWKDEWRPMPKGKLKRQVGVRWASLGDETSQNLTKYGESITACGVKSRASSSLTLELASRAKSEMLQR